MGEKATEPPFYLRLSWFRYFFWSHLKRRHTRSAQPIWHGCPRFEYQIFLKDVNPPTESCNCVHPEGRLELFSQQTRQVWLSDAGCRWIFYIFFYFSRCDSSCCSDSVFCVVLGCMGRLSHKVLLFCFRFFPSNFDFLLFGQLWWKSDAGEAELGERVMLEVISVVLFFLVYLLHLIFIREVFCEVVARWGVFCGIFGPEIGPCAVFFCAVFTYFVWVNDVCLVVASRFLS